MPTLDKVTSLAARWTTLRVELAIPAEVDFDSKRLSPLDMIAIQRLQQALITVPSNVYVSFGTPRTCAREPGRSALNPSSSQLDGRIWRRADARSLPALRLGVVRARVEETGKAFTTSSCSLATQCVFKS